MATIPQHYKQGFQSVVRLIESFEMQIEHHRSSNVQTFTQFIQRVRYRLDKLCWRIIPKSGEKIRAEEYVQMLKGQDNF